MESFFAPRQLLIADGHHRYEAAVAFAAEDGADRMMVVLVSVDDPGRFRIALTEAHNLPRDEVLALLAQRRELLAASLDAHRSARDRAIAHGSLPQFLIEVHRQAALLDADIAWLDEAVEFIRRPDTVWGVVDIPATDRYLAQREAARA